MTSQSEGTFYFDTHFEEVKDVLIGRLTLDPGVCYLRGDLRVYAVSETHIAWVAGGSVEGQRLEPEEIAALEVTR